jgi:ATP-binding cassette subfamily F protein uup
MTYNERKEFETIMDDISLIEEEIETLSNKINNSYMNYALVKDEMERKELLEKQLEEKILRWEYLSDLDEKSKK